VSRPLLSARDLVKRYPLRSGLFGRDGSFAVVDGVSFDVGRGETLGLVGESGSGKSTIGRLLLRLEEPTEGRVFFDGEDWLAIEGTELRRKRRDLQIIFQDPQTSLNPRMTCGVQIAEPLRVQRIARGRQLSERVAALLDEVGLSRDMARRFPSELSGGQRQRVAIARALATRPKFVVCDEPVSALDVSVAAQVLNLLADLRERNALSYLFISHDLAVVSRVADRIAVMYLGRIVEEGPAHDVIHNPQHPYTRALLSVVPETTHMEPQILRGETPDPTRIPSGCRFHPRCPLVESGEAARLGIESQCTGEDPLFLPACHAVRSADEHEAYVHER
jgi:oligopeptide/dipeptide ABC transporter ATP-binding protein